MGDVGHWGGHWDIRSMQLKLSGGERGDMPVLYVKRTTSLHTIHADEKAHGLNETSVSVPACSEQGISVWKPGHDDEAMRRMLAERLFVVLPVVPGLFYMRHMCSVQVVHDTCKTPTIG